MQRNRLVYLLFLVILWQRTGAQTCIPVDINTTATNPEGISQYECINVSGVFNPDSPWPTEPIYPVWSGTQINVGGETRVSAENADAVTLFVDPTPIYFTRLVPPATGNALKFEKVEFGLRLPAEAETRIQNFVNETPSVPKLNPFDPLDVDIRAEFEYEFSAYQWQLRGQQYGFYYREYELDTTGAGPTWHRNEIPVTEKFRVRYAPDKTGNWRVRFVVYLNGIGTYTTLYSNFFVAPSNNPGYMKVSADGRYFELGDEFFYPVGQVQASPSCGGEYCDDMGFELVDTNWNYDTQWSPEGNMPGFRSVKAYRQYEQVLRNMKAGGANYFRLIMDEEGLAIEFEKLGNYNNRMPLAWEMDRILETSEELGLKMTMDLALHTRFENGSVYYSQYWDWPTDSCTKQGYCYNTIPGVNKPTDMYTSVTARRYYKNQLRYMMARYGYSTSIGLYELMSEVNNVGQGKVFANHWDNYWHRYSCYQIDSILKPYETDPAIPHKVYKWQDEMLGYIKNDLLHGQHPLGVCYAGNSCRIDLGDSSYFSPNVDYIGFNNGQIILNRFGQYEGILHEFNNSLGIHKPLINSEITYIDYSDCEQYVEWYKNIWTPPFVGVALTTNWEYQLHRTSPNEWIFGSLVNFLQGSDYRNINGYTWTPVKEDENNARKSFMYCMKGQNGSIRKAEGVVFSRNFNFYTYRESNTKCGTIPWGNPGLIGLNFVVSDTVMENVNPQSGLEELRIPDMGSGVQCYKVYWYDPLTQEWFYTDTQYPHPTQGYLVIEHPTLTAQIPGWENFDFHSGVRPLLAFKVRRCNEDPPNGMVVAGTGSMRKLEEIINEELGAEDQNLDKEEIEGKPETFIHLYPNPTNNDIWIDVSEEYAGARWQLISATGSNVENGVLRTNTTTIRMSLLNAGMYWLKVFRTDGGTQTFKIVKQ